MSDNTGPRQDWRTMQACGRAVLRALGPSIRARRKAAGYTLTEAAGRIPSGIHYGLSQPGGIWAKIEASRTPPSLLVLLLIADALGTSASQLLADAEALARATGDVS